MEGPAHRQGDGPLALELAAHTADGVRAAGEDYLGTAVVVGDHHALGGVHQRFEFTAVKAHHGGHRAAAGGGHQLAAGLHQLDARLGIEHPGGVEGHQFPEAVARHQIGAAALGLQAIHQQALHHKEGRLGVAGVVQVAEVTFGFAIADREQVAAQQVGGGFKASLGTRELQHPCGHAHLLRTLSRENPGVTHGRALN